MDRPNLRRNFRGIDPARAAQVAASLPSAKKGTVRSEGNYEVGQSAFVLAYTKDNLAHVIYPVGLKTEDWVHDLPFLISETWTTP